jgi:hypothetical protein
MMRAGECWALSTPELLTGGSGSGLWPTPRAEEGYQGDGAAQAYLDAGCKQPKERNGKQRGKSTFDTTLTTAVAAKLWPTPTEACATGGQTSRGGNRKNELLLSGMVKMFPTPTSGDAKASGSRNTENSNAHPGLSLTDFVRQDGGKGRTWSTPTARDANNGQEIIEPLPVQVGGTLNPTWVEWLMGWPLGWTALDASAMDKFRAWWRSHGGFSANNE